MNDAPVLGAGARKLQLSTLGIGVLTLAACGAYAVLDRAQFFQSYLLGYLFWLLISLGALGLLMIHNLTAGRWGFAVQRLLEAAARTLPLMLVLFIPIVIGMKDLFVWASPETVTEEHLVHMLHHKAGYLNTPFFLGRAAFYFFVWIALTFLLSRWSKQLDDGGEPTIVNKMRRVSGPGIALFMLTGSFAGFDWMMSLDPYWFSTIYGAWFVVGQGLSTFAFVIIALHLLSEYTDLGDAAIPDRFHELGNLMMAFVMLWAYISFSQFLIIWSGNIPEEIPWYVHRMQAGWDWMGGILLIFHFAVPFLILLSRRVKRRAAYVAWVGVAILLARYIDLFWHAVPNFRHGGIEVHLMDVAAPIGVGGLWVAYFLWQLGTRALVPQNDPRMQGGPSHG